MALVLLALAWLGGIASVALWNAPAWLAGVYILALLPALLQGWLPRKPVILVAAVVMATLGAARFDAWQNADAPDLTQYVGERVELTGRVRDLPRPGLTTVRYEVEVGQIHGATGPNDTSGAVIVTLDQYARLEPGSLVRVEGTLDAPPVFEDFDYRAYLARRGVVATMFYPSVVTEAAAPRWSPTRIVADVRQRLEHAIHRSLPEPQAAVAAGIALGRAGNIPDDLYEDYRVAGLAHVLAVSGAHVSVLSAIVFFVLLQLVGRRWAIWPAIVVVIVYVFLAGAAFSVIRAGIMAAIFLTGMYLGRQQASLAALGAAAILMTLVRPATALDAGFQLSLSATAGLIVFAPWIRAGVGYTVERFQLRALVPPLAEYIVALSVAASITTAPLLWINFGQIPIVGPLSNVVVEPMFGLSFMLSFGTAIAGAIWEPAGWLFGLAAYYPVALLSWTATTFSNIPYASVSVPRVSANWALAAYALMAIPGWFAYRHLAPIPERLPLTHKERDTRRIVVGAIGGALVAIVAWHSLLPLRAPSDVELTMLDVGQGDAFLLTTPAGRHVLIDGGPSGIALARQLGAKLPHWKRDIDVVILSHPDADHLGGLPELFHRSNVGQVYDNGFAHTSALAARYDETTFSRTTLAAGDTLDLDGMRFSVLWPSKGAEALESNEQSLVLAIQYGEITFLLTGDIEHESQHALVANGLGHTTILKVPHHGAATSSRSFLEATGAPIALISAGEGNRFGHPAISTLNQLHGARIYRTDLHGRVSVRTDGESVTVETER